MRSDKASARGGLAKLVEIDSGCVICGVLNDASPTFTKAGEDCAVQMRGTSAAAPSAFGAEDWFDPIEAAPRARIKQAIEERVVQEAGVVLGQGRALRGAESDYRHGARPCRLPARFCAV